MRKHWNTSSIISFRHTLTGLEKYINGARSIYTAKYVKINVWSHLQMMNQLMELENYTHVLGISEEYDFRTQKTIRRLVFNSQF